MTQTASETRRQLPTNVLIVALMALAGLILGVAYVLFVYLPVATTQRELHPQYTDPSANLPFTLFSASLFAVLYGTAVGAVLVIVRSAVARATQRLWLRVLAGALTIASSTVVIYAVAIPEREKDAATVVYCGFAALGLVAYALAERRALNSVGP